MNPALFVFSGLAVVAGTLFPIQSAINARLSSGVGGPVFATLISFAAGFVALVAIAAVMVARQPPDWNAIGTLPPWWFVAGGLLGATYLGLNVFLVPRIGAGAMMALAIAGQMISAMTIDSLGLLGTLTRELTSGRLIGLVFVVIGAAMVRFL